MKIHLVSDLHNEFSPYPFEKPIGTDVVIAAGDIAVGDKGPLFLRESFGPHVPIVYVAGNHEHYKQGLVENTAKIFKEAERLKVWYLQMGYVIIDGIEFIGGTLWTDYLLWGEDMRQVCKSVARDYMNDFRRISYRKEPWERFTPECAEKEHYALRWFIESRLKICKEERRKSVVVTHMAPHPKSVDDQYSNKFDLDGKLSASYASNLESLILEYESALWVHGHMHSSFDYMVGKTRIVCNPRGYSSPVNPTKQENEKFNPELLLEI